MVDTKRFTLVEPWGYEDKGAAYAQIQILYPTLKGVTTYFSEGRWYIVLSKALSV